MGNCLTCLNSSDSDRPSDAHASPDSAACRPRSAPEPISDPSSPLASAPPVHPKRSVDPERSEHDSLLSASPPAARDDADGPLGRFVQPPGAKFTYLSCPAGDEAAASRIASPEPQSPKAAFGTPESGVPSFAQQAVAAQISDNTLNALFETYKDVDEAILADGIERLCADLGYKPDDFAVLVLAWRLNASQMCRFTKAEFIQGLHAMRANTVPAIRRRLDDAVEAFRRDRCSGDAFKQLYRFTFAFGLEADQRSMALDMAVVLWRLVFSVCPPAILGRWLAFLERHPPARGVPKDTWNMFLNFAETVDITAYDDTEAWPSLFDDFVEYETDRTNQNESKFDERDAAERGQTLS